MLHHEQKQQIRTGGQDERCRFRNTG